MTPEFVREIVMRLARPDDLATTTAPTDATYTNEKMTENIALYQRLGCLESKRAAYNQ